MGIRQLDLPVERKIKKSGAQNRNNGIFLYAQYTLEIKHLQIHYSTI